METRVQKHSSDSTYASASSSSSSASSSSHSTTTASSSSSSNNSHTLLVQDTTSKDSSDNHGAWFPYHDVLIHQELFKRGVTVVKAYDGAATEEPALATSTMLTLRERKLTFTPSSTKEIQNRLDHDILSANCLTSIAEYASEEADADKNPNHTEFKKVRGLLSEMLKDSSIEQDKLAIFNPARREEIFLPLRLQNETGLYLYPWLSKRGLPFKFTGFTKFVTAGCMFGPALQGADQYGNKQELIKHNIQLFPEQHFERIIYNPKAANIYQNMLFSELKNFAAFIRQFSASGAEKPQLLYHLPYYDYVLFGIELYLREKITKPALNSLFKVIFEQKDYYTQRINAIFERDKIAVTIVSPFENLFNISFTSCRKTIADAILEELNITSEKPNIAKIIAIAAPHLPLHAQQAWSVKLLTETVGNTKEASFSSFAAKILNTLLPHASKEEHSRLIQQLIEERVKDCVLLCVQKLKTNTYNTMLQQVWSDLAHPHVQVNSLEDLFKIANAVVIGASTYGNEPYKTCSLLPLSEKQIQLAYIDYTKHLATANPKVAPLYPPIFNATVLDPLVTYASNTNTHDGLPFYFNECQESVASLIHDKQLLRHAHRNVFIFASNQRQRDATKQAKSLQDLLPLEEPSTTPRSISRKCSSPDLRTG